MAAQLGALGTAPVPWPPRWGRWVLACSAAEFIGMVAAAAIAVFTAYLVGEPKTLTAAVVVVGGAMLGGAIEGAAVGEFQFRVLRGWLTGLSRRRYVGSTVLLAVLFWMLGMLPSTLISMAGSSSSPQATATDPPTYLVALFAAVGGAFGGLAFGAVQGWALRGHVPHPWRWVRPNVVGWALAVAIITVGASNAPAGGGAAVIAVGILVGVLAGLAVGVVTGQALPSLQLDLPWWNRMIVDLALSPWRRLLPRSVMVLRFRGRRSGRTVTLPIQGVAPTDRAQLVVYVAGSERKSWWRNFTDARELMAVHGGRRLTGVGVLCQNGSTTYSWAKATYRSGQPRVNLPEDAVFVVVNLDPAAVAEVAADADVRE